jgi:ZIP family zinc transporter
MLCGRAVHNVPEGIASSAPIYFATGNRRQAFIWGSMSGASEPVGAILGWLVLRPIMGPSVFGSVFGIVAGMMVFIAVSEALPTAHKYDPDGGLATKSAFAGMLIMALSMLIFDYV